jgi:hypothetical protein
MCKTSHSSDMIYVAVVALVSPVHMLVPGACSWVRRSDKQHAPGTSICTYTPHACARL